MPSLLNRIRDSIQSVIINNSWTAEAAASATADLNNNNNKGRGRKPKKQAKRQPFGDATNKSASSSTLKSSESSFKNDENESSATTNYEEESSKITISEELLSLSRPPPPPPLETDDPEPSTLHQKSVVCDNGSDNNSRRPFPLYRLPSEVPARSNSMIGQKVQLKSSLADRKKRSVVGTVVQWKNKSTVLLQCDDDGHVIGVRLSSIEKFIIDTNLNGDGSASSVDANNNGQEAEQNQSQRSKNNESTTTNHHSVVVNVASNYHQHDVKPSQVPARCPSIIGRRVQVKDSIKDRKKRNATGTVIRWTRKDTVEIKCDDSGNVFGVRVRSIEFIQDGIGGAAAVEKEEILSQQQTAPVTTMSKAPKRGQIKRKVLRVTPRGSTRSSSPTTQISAAGVPSTDEGSSWQVPGSLDNVGGFGSFRIERIRLKADTDGKPPETTFLGHILNNRMNIADVPLNGKRNQIPFEKKIEDRFTGNTYELVSCKYDDDTETASFGFSKHKRARLVYAITNGPELNPFSVEDHLLRVADFTRLDPRKIVARLELFQSPSNLNIVFLDSSYDFGEIPDRGYVGGGFIYEDKLKEVLEKAGMSPTHASRVVAVQVRLFIPSMGVYKGMLVKKHRRCTNDGAAAFSIELPPSMKKVLKSSHPQAQEGAAILICKNKVVPSPGSANEYIGRKLDPSLKDPPEKSFKEKIKKPLTDMVFRLWRTMGVPKDLCDRYGMDSLSPERRNHAWLVGVPDPTNSLPPDTVFVPGMKESQPGEIFITRSPCYAYEHGRKLLTVTAKPPNMSVEVWDWLNDEFRFGVVIFSNPRLGKKSIPERIANGDLDGDLYLVCWDEEILASMKASPLVDEVSYDDGTLSTVPLNPNWFHEAQDILIDAGFSNEMDRLTGTLYKLGEKIADRSESILKHPDANAYYEAFNQALEFKKHGRPIILPGHLIDKIPSSLRHLLAESPDSC